MTHGQKVDAGIQIKAGLSGYAVELCAFLIGVDLGLPTDHIDNHAAYIDSWLRILKRDSRAVFTAAAKAEAAAGYLLRATHLDADIETDEAIAEAA